MQHDFPMRKRKGAVSGVRITKTAKAVSLHLWMPCAIIIQVRVLVHGGNRRPVEDHQRDALAFSSSFKALTNSDELHENSGPQSPHSTLPRPLRLLG